MRELYSRPVAEVIEFDAKDVITTSGQQDFTDDFEAGMPGDANQDSGWTGLY